MPLRPPRDKGALEPHINYTRLYDDLVEGHGSLVNADMVDGQHAYTDAQAVTAVEAEPTLNLTGVITIAGIGDGGMANYDLLVGDITTPSYGMIRFGDAVIGRTSYNVAACDLDGVVVFRNMGTPPTSYIEFVWTESGGDAIRFALAKSGVGNATYNPRSMLIAGAAILRDDIVTVGYWQGQGIFHNLLCDTNQYGADLGVQNNLEVEGNIFTDSIKESTPNANITFSNSITLLDGKFTIFDKASGNGIKVDTTTPTFGWRDLLGQIRTRGVGGTDPNDATYRGNIKAYKFSVNDEFWVDYHIPHDYVKGTDIFLHFHWSHISTLVNGGSVTWGADITYAKGHNQMAFVVPVNTTVLENASTNQYQQMIIEVQISTSGGAAGQIDTDNIEPDGVIQVRGYLSANNITVSSGGVPEPFLHFMDIHYQSTNIGTKDKVPDFYT